MNSKIILTRKEYYNLNLKTDKDHLKYQEELLEWATENWEERSQKWRELSLFVADKFKSEEERFKRSLGNNERNILLGNIYTAQQNIKFQTELIKEYLKEINIRTIIK